MKLITEFIATCRHDDLDKQYVNTLDQLQLFLIAHAENPALSAAVSYLAATWQNFRHKFELSAELMLASTRLWCHTDQVLDYFSSLKLRNKAIYLQVLTKIREDFLVDSRNLSLHAHHIDAVVRMIESQKQLPSSILSELCAYLDAHHTQLKIKIQALRIAHLPDITRQATTQHLLHHTLQHAAEMKVRAVHLLTQVLGLFTDNKPDSIFLYHIIRFTIECHDHSQHEKGRFASVEEETADRIARWLLETVFNVPPPEPIVKLLQFIANYIVILGTTMVYSPVATLDLFELFCVFEDAETALAPEDQDSGNVNFLAQLKVVTIITGICDKCPAAIYELVKHQMQVVNSEHALKNVFALSSVVYPSRQSAKITGFPSLLPCEQVEQKLVLDEFFAQLRPYHVITGETAEYLQKLNIQAFLIAIVPHICMRIELCFRTDPVIAQILIDFITACQNMHGTLTKEDFMDYFDEHFFENSVFEHMTALFFKNIANESAFCCSQTMTLRFYATQLGACGLYVNPNVAEIDAYNLAQLQQFFQEIDHLEQITLVRELTLCAILQAGLFYNENPDLASECTSPAGKASITSKEALNNQSQKGMLGLMASDLRFYQSVVTTQQQKTTTLAKPVDEASPLQTGQLR